MATKTKELVDFGHQQILTISIISANSRSQIHKHLPLYNKYPNKLSHLSTLLKFL